MSLAFTLRQLRYENLSFWRNPPAAFFTFALPLIFLFILTSVFGNERFQTPVGAISGATYYVPAIVSLSVITACFTNLAMMVSISRERGILKRLRGTPLPAGSYVAARILHSILISVLLVAIVIVFGTAVYDVDPPTDRSAALVVTLAIGAAAFCALGLAMTIAIRSEDAAPATINGLILPLEGISGIFFSIGQAPEWLRSVAGVFPVKPFTDALLVVFDPTHRGSAFQWDDLAVVGLWGVIGIFLTLRYFSWEPRR